MYRVVPSPGAPDECEGPGAVLLGETPLSLTPEKGLKPGPQPFCVEADAFAPQRVTVDVRSSGPTKRDPITLVPLARIHFNWDPSCPYRVPPASISVKIDRGQPTAYPHFPPDSIAIPPGPHDVAFIAEGFAQRRVRIQVGPPGSAEVQESICLDPTAYLSVHGRKGVHPLDGLYLQVSTKDEVILWRGAAPSGTDEIRVPLRPTDRGAIDPGISVSVFADDRYRVLLPRAAIAIRRLDDDAAGNPSLAVWIEMPSAPVPGNVDRAAMRRTCLDTSEPNPMYCAGEAYLRVDADHQDLASGDTRKLLVAGCGLDDIASCAPLAPRTPVSTAPKGLTAEEVLATACEEPAQKLRWLACLRVRQPDKPGGEFLYFDGNVPTPPQPSTSLGVDGGLRVMTVETIDPRPATVVSVTFPFVLFSPTHWFGVGAGLRPLEIAVVPAQTASGSPRGYFALGGTGIEALLAVKIGDRVRFDLVGFMAGYFNASASTVGGHLSVSVALNADAQRQHFISAYGGVLGVPQIVEVGGEGVPEGRAVRPCAGIGYMFAFTDKNN